VPKTWLGKLADILRPAPNRARRSFSLGRRRSYRPPGTQEGGPAPAGTREQPAGLPEGPGDDALWGETVSARLDENLNHLRRLFRLPLNSDIVVREFRVGSSPAVRAALVFIEGLVDKDQLNLAVLQPLMVLARAGRPLPRRRRAQMVADLLLPHNQVKVLEELAPLVEAVLAGNAAMFLDGEARGLVVEVRGFKSRAVEQPTSEVVVRGPKQAFTENLRVNAAMIRRALRCPALVAENWKLGRLTRTDVVLFYVDGLTNPDLVDEMRRRLSTVDTDRVLDSGMLEDLLEDAPALLPTMLATERPDRVATFLADGHVALLVGDSPFALVAPMTFTGFFHSPEDSYLRWPLGTALRLVRLFGIFTSLLLPALYLALVNYHEEMIPTELALAIASAREAVPFPSVVEVFLLEISFELIREAGIRIPSVIGPTIGIVGAVIIGQAAVTASLVSPILVIIVALTALGSFAVPNYCAAMLLRPYRFAFILLAATSGFFGIAAGMYVIALVLCSTKSFGVPYMSPIAPFRGTGPDIVVRGPVYKLHLRPSFLRPLDALAQRPVQRRWDPQLAGEAEGGGGPRGQPERPR